MQVLEPMRAKRLSASNTPWSEVGSIVLVADTARNWQVCARLNRRLRLYDMGYSVLPPS